MAAAGGVPEALVGALRAVLTDADVDGALVAATISLPSASELIDDIPGVDPVVLHDVRRALLLRPCSGQAGPCIWELLFLARSEVSGAAWAWPAVKACFQAGHFMLRTRACAADALGQHELHGTSCITVPTYGPNSITTCARGSTACTTGHCAATACQVRWAGSHCHLHSPHACSPAR